MDPEPDLTTPEPLRSVLEAVVAREPLFHHRHLVADRDDFDREVGPGFWEVGASGRRYSREFVWSVVAERLATLDVDPFVSEGWQVTELDHRTVRVDIDRRFELFIEDHRPMEVSSAGQLPTGFDPQVLYPSRSHPATSRAK